MKKKRVTFRDRLEPFGNLMADFRVSVGKLLLKMSDNDLDKLQAASKHVSQTNCWFASFDAAPFIQELVNFEKINRLARKRAQAKKEPNEKNS